MTVMLRPLPARIAPLLLLAGSWLASGCDGRRVPPAPTIEFSTVPEAAEGGSQSLRTIDGRVVGARPGQQIVLYAKSGGWWVQPLASAPFTAIRPDSTWRSLTHLGTEYAALLVEPGYHPPARADALPPQGGPIVAVAVTKGRGSAPASGRTLHFSGYDWAVRQVPSDRGGTPSLYDPDNAWTDANGRLHLRIAGEPGQWTCAEVMLTRSLGYGTYTFVVDDISHLEPAAVFSVLTWDDLGADQNHREVDIEITRWGDPGGKNAQYVVQPFYVPANVARFTAPAGALIHSFRWEQGRVSFRSVQRGPAGGAARALAEHVFTSGVPSPGGESVRMNLYVFGHTRNPLKNGTQVVIEKFEYLP